MRLFDLHCDTLYECEKQGFSLSVNPLQLDLTRGRHYTPWSQVFAVWVPDTLRGRSAFKWCEDCLHSIRAQAASRPRQLTIVTDVASWNDAIAGDRCAAILAVESGAAIAGDIRNLSALFRLGVRILTVTWNGENEWGYGCECNAENGLKPFGKQAVKEAQRLGIVLDVSHLNERGFWDVAEISQTPFIASHSVSYTVNEHPRNLKDDQFLAIAERGGVVGLNFCKSQLGEQTFDAIYRHLDHFLSLGGEKAVAFGGDLDGTDLPPSWGGIAVYEDLWGYLSKKGYKDALLTQIFFQNAANFFADALQ